MEEHAEALEGVGDLGDLKGDPNLLCTFDEGKVCKLGTSTLDKVVIHVQVVLEGALLHGLTVCCDEGMDSSFQVSLVCVSKVGSGDLLCQARSGLRSEVDQGEFSSSVTKLIGEFLSFILLCCLTHGGIEWWQVLHVGALCHL